MTERYDIEAYRINGRNGDCCEAQWEANEAPDGAYVHYLDYEKLVQALREIYLLDASQGRLAGIFAKAALLIAKEPLDA